MTKEAKKSSRKLIVSVAAPVILAILYRFVIACAPQRITIKDDNNQVVQLTTEQVAEYKTFGFVVVRGLFPPDQRDALVQAGKDYYSKRHLLDFLFSRAFAKLGLQIWRQEQLFANVALTGVLPNLAKQLMMDEQPLSSVRLLKDGFFGFRPKNNTGCGFHIDDRGFWPATDSTTGVNFWIALSDITAKEGGGIRVVPQNALEQQTAEECLSVIRGTGAASYNTTCKMQELSPSCYEKMIEVSVVHDLAPGDALIWDRRTFHASEPFHPDYVEGDDPKLRYTVRYVPGEAIAEGMLHPSVMQGKVFDTPFHPQVWPSETIFFFLLLLLLLASLSIKSHLLTILIMKDH